jgi:pimeloyl-ACP methyl ester carboxylesterase
MRFHIRHWGKSGAPKLFMLHGWMDSSITFQFVVDAFVRDWHIIAPDWRGFGHSSWAKDGYWYPDYLADLEAILDHYSPEEPVRLLGHSMGGNVACLYAGVRPARVAQLVSLEGYGMMRMEPDQAAGRYARWLDSLNEHAHPRAYHSLEDVTRRVKRNNPRLTDERAAFIASHWAEKNSKGEWHILADPRHRRVNPILTRMDEVLASWRLITAPTLMVDAEFSLLGMRMEDYGKGREEIRRRASAIPDVKVVMVKGAAHMVQQDQPEVVAALIEDFLP